MRRSTATATATTLAGTWLLFGACAEADTTGTHVTRRDSLGIEIVEIPAPVAVWRLAEEADVRIGVLDGDPAHQFAGVRFVHRLSDGGFIVGDAGSNEVRSYTAEGQHQGSIGRNGAGPREFNFMTKGLRLAGDTTVVYDSRNQRLTFITPDLQWGEELSTTRTGDVLRSLATIVGLTAEHELVIGRPADIDMDGEGATYVRGPMAFVRMSPEAEQADTLFTLPGPETVMDVRESDGRFMVAIGPPPFGYAVVSTYRDGHLFVIQNEDAEVRVFTAQGAPQRILRLVEHPTPPVTSADRERLMDDFAEAAIERDADPRAARDEAARRLGFLPEPHHHPSFTDMLVADDGSLWLREFTPQWAAEDDPTWTVLDAGGEALARITLPVALRPFHVDRHGVTGVERDDFDVEYVVTYPIVRSGSVP